MSEEFKKKYKKESENIQIDFSLDNYVLLPDSRVKCNIFLKPKFEFKLGRLDNEIIIKLTQFEKCEFKGDNDDTKSKEKETLLLTKKFTKHFPEIMSKKISIKDIEFEVPPYKNKMALPTFEFRKKETNLFVRHLLTLEIPDLEIIESIGVIICRIPDKIYKIERRNSNIFKDEAVNSYFGLKSEGKISYNLSLKKQVFNPKEEIPINVTINSTELKNLNVDSIEFILQKKLNIHAFFFSSEEKIIMDRRVLNNLKSDNKIIKISEQLKFENKDIPELTKKEIEKYSNFNENFIERDDNRIQLNPTMNGNLFNCEYKVKINIIFNNIFRKTIYEFFIIDIYDIYNIDPESIPSNLKHCFLIKENIYFNSQNSGNKEDIKNEKEDKKEESCYTNLDGFELIQHEDFISTVEGKIINKKESKK